jgi:hypothetical protein
MRTRNKPVSNKNKREVVSVVAPSNVPSEIANVHTLDANQADAAVTVMMHRRKTELREAQQRLVTAVEQAAKDVGEKEKERERLMHDVVNAYDVSEEEALLSDVRKVSGSRTSAFSVEKENRVGDFDGRTIRFDVVLRYELGAYEKGVFSRREVRIPLSAEIKRVQRELNKLRDRWSRLSSDLHAASTAIQGLGSHEDALRAQVSRYALNLTPQGQALLAGLEAVPYVDIAALTKNI